MATYTDQQKQDLVNSMTEFSVKERDRVAKIGIDGKKVSEVSVRNWCKIFKHKTLGYWLPNSKGVQVTEQPQAQQVDVLDILDQYTPEDIKILRAFKALIESTKGQLGSLEYSMAHYSANREFIDDEYKKPVQEYLDNQDKKNQL